MSVSLTLWDMRLRNSEPVSSNLMAVVEAGRTIKADDAVLVEVGFVDKILQLRVAGIETELLHDLAKLRGGDVT